MLHISVAPERKHALLMRELPRLVLVIAGILLLVLTVLRAAQSWSNDAHLEHVSGTWTALAVDLKDGVFYRAPFGPHGYGGTQYFPLFFCLHAVAMKLFGSWRGTGYALSAVSVGLLLVAVDVLLRRLGANRWLAAGAATAVLAGSSVQDALLTIREDTTAAMLNLWAVALCAGGKGGRLYLPAVLFAMAFAAKETTVFGLGAVFLSFLLTGRAKTAWRLLAFTLGGYAVVLAGIYLGSHGRAFEVLRLTAAPGVNLGRILSSPMELVDTMSTYLGEIIFIAFGTALLLATRWRKMGSIPPLLFLCTAAVTCLIYSSEGNAGNHLVDLHIAAVVLLVSWAGDEAQLDFGVSSLAAACFIALLGLVLQHASADSVPVREKIQEIVRAIGKTDKPILAENPLVAVEAGQHPYLLDAFMFRVIRGKDPSFADPLWLMLREKRFSAVVLINNPDNEEGRTWYSTAHFGKGFVEQLERDYERVGTPGDQYLYMPRGTKKSAVASSTE